MGRYSGKSCRLICMMVMTSTFFVAEITTGYITSSMALVADSFHMLSDIVSLIVGFVAIKVSKLTTSRNTYGWVRAEVVGALVNGVFLVALCFTIFVEALQRFIEKEIEVEKPLLVLGVGTAGLVVNLLGLCLFSGHGHSHGGGGHGHSHGGGENSPSHGNNGKSTKDAPNVEYKGLKDDNNEESAKSLLKKENGSNFNCDVTDQAIVKVEDGEEDLEATIASDSQLNMRGVFLHVLGDALSSVVAIISALIIHFVEGDWRFYVDPAMSLFICVIILATSVPLLKQSAMSLMQSIPSHVDVENITSLLKEQFPNISLHDFHVWQLMSNLTIATAHIIVTGDVDNYMAMSESLKEFFHKRGIHSTTIQPEFVRDSTDSALIEASCVLVCKTDACDSQRCCKPKSED
ncbi:zinc transporter 1-like isoform X1 [Anneissia japonica]|uniref:zinc transporter 1-like isoform X1 n=1 Tax=Anneissia japonica TaxID=1529436 RepID=UPI001425AD2D|nr:zinc transporter 1-like isoform X1 [Anneissia japonica]